MPNLIRSFGRSAAAAVAASLLLPGARVGAQAARDSSRHAVHELLLRTDNDAFDFWQRPWNRPDEDYTSGVRIVYEIAWPPWWGARIWPRVPRCDGAAVPCTTATVWIGQDIYTAERDTSGNFATVNARQSAGWLYYGERFGRVGAQRADQLELTLGVTGTASLARYSQSLAHAMAPALNRPIDWSHQLAFEPGLIATYEHDELITLGPAGPVSLQVIPSATATVGNVFTQGSARLQARFGLNLRNPWLPTRSGDPAQLVLSAAAAEFAVARDLFLDGSTFRRDPHVGHEPFYAERAVGLTVVYGALTFGYRVVMDGRMYGTGRAHAWGSMTGGVTLGR